MKFKLLFVLLFLICLQLKAQWMWYNPVKSDISVLQGQGWTAELKGSYARFPNRAKDKIRPDVFGLSRNSAGLAIHFYSNAKQIQIRYKVAGGYAMPHMPATGVSGVDLYAKGMHGEDLWCAGKYNFQDTIVYTFNGLTYHARHGKGYEYRLYLPLYNSVKWLEIGVPENSYFEFIPMRSEKPIVVYGTSIAQGACASRPGMAWTSILERKLDCPLINLGFSGNGRLEKEVLELINEVDSRLYILDCMPNMTREDGKKIEQLLMDAVRQIRQDHPETPVLVVEHDGYANGGTNKGDYDSYVKTNVASKNAFKNLQEDGIKNIYYLSYEEIGMSIDAMVDGVHATDFGMMQYAAAYEKVIRNILNEPIGGVSTTCPVSQRREANGYEWKKRHNEILELNRTNPPRAVIIGNSITHYWGGKPESKHKNGATSWEAQMETAGYRNLGFGWDRIENVLWRIYRGELDGFKAEKVVLMIGTNNLEVNTDDEIVEGLYHLILAVKKRQPEAEIKVIGILPRRNGEKRIALINKRVRGVTKLCKVDFVDVGQELLTSKKQVDELLFLDGLHPNEKGYGKIVDKIK